jgi:putative addiction module component (TIGR02574 family)
LGGKAEINMNMHLHDLPLEERLRLVEDLWDSIAAEQEKLPLTPKQRVELDRRLAAYRVDRNRGQDAFIVIERIRDSL